LFFPGIPREEKGIDLFLDALTKLGPLPAARFFLTGSSAITDPETQKLLQEALARLGESLAVSPAIPDMADYQAAVQASDFVVCCHRPAAYAGRASGVLNDAIAAGVPVIAPDYGVFRRVRDWDIGYLYPPEDPGALAGTIVRAVSERRDFTAALAEVRARYSETSQVKQLDDLLAL
jgi:glycosyltransferase involved in cell wall biosynthesis